MTANEMSLSHSREQIRNAQRLIWTLHGTPREIRDAYEAEWRAGDAKSSSGRPPIPQITSWGDLNLRLICAHSKVRDVLDEAEALADVKIQGFDKPTKVRVFIKGKNHGAWEYSDLKGFRKENQNGKPPNAAWKTLLELADADGRGIEKYKRGGGIDGAKNGVAQLNKALRDNFGPSSPAVTSNASNRYVPAFALVKPARLLDFSAGYDYNREVLLPPDEIERVHERHKEKERTGGRRTKATRHEE